ncbi:polyketide cyclase/dehydrase and lipid transport [Leptospira broomii serovar Hurstbridge str. 5399]|uniref:Polyketide cyclase/dehydrase and lipid transport n=1 Tax=Leptospira broomii serovar Hurstbridge str. 5399 TaxID=1049789 RepID=T0EZZ6_9LEPT|nr:polyketide cyclase [Leptospira broomii]EQA44485.1 polyketide cyclase/dehydrase and lipid transport [Leptospira broomii serovar Hurstbridge str. 5399]
MWEYKYRMEVQGVSAKELWEARADISNWPKWDSGLLWTKIEGSAAVDKEFELKPKGGPKVKVKIIEAQSPRSFGDETYLLGARMKFLHFFEDTKNGTEVRVELSIHGPLSFLWKKIIGEEQVKNMREEIITFADFVREAKK